MQWAMQCSLERHDALLRAAIETYRGHVFKAFGDAFCAAFHTPLDALGAAIPVELVRRAPGGRIPCTGVMGSVIQLYPSGYYSSDSS